MKILSGSSCRPLAEDVCSKLGISLGSAAFQQYSNGCFELISKEEISQEKVFLMQTSLPDICSLHKDMWELLQMVNLAKVNNAKEIVAVMPYVSYARSDKRYEEGMGICGQLLVKLLENSGITGFIGIDFHSDKFESFFSVKAYNLSAGDILADSLREEDLGNSFLLPADGGILKRGRVLAEKLGIPCGEVKKERISDKQIKFKEISGEIRDKDVIIFDDEISSGTTSKTLAEEALKRGAKSITLVATHGLFTGEAINNFKNTRGLKEVVITDTILVKEEIKNYLPVKVISVASLLAQKIQELEQDREKMIR